MPPVMAPSPITAMLWPDLFSMLIFAWKHAYIHNQWASANDPLLFESPLLHLGVAGEGSSGSPSRSKLCTDRCWGVPSTKGIIHWPVLQQAFAKCQSVKCLCWGPHSFRFANPESPPPWPSEPSNMWILCTSKNLFLIQLCTSSDSSDQW